VLPPSVLAAADRLLCWSIGASSNGSTIPRSGEQ
jgi:hypothetical protein